MNYIEIPNSALPARSGNDSSIGHGFELVLPVKPDQLALNLHPVRRQDADLVEGIGGVEQYLFYKAGETTYRRLLLFDQPHHNNSALRAVCYREPRRIPGQDFRLYP